jgi:hypothetical protein
MCGVHVSDRRFPGAEIDEQLAAQFAVAQRIATLLSLEYIRWNTPSNAG